MYWVVKKNDMYWQHWSADRHVPGAAIVVWTPNRWEAHRFFRRVDAEEIFGAITHPDVCIVRVVPKGSKPRSSSLAKYLEAKLDAKGGFGWVPRYEATVTTEPNPAFMCGHYHALLDDLITLIGTWNAARLARAYDAVNEVGT